MSHDLVPIPSHLLPVEDDPSPLAQRDEAFVAHIMGELDPEQFPAFAKWQFHLTEDDWTLYLAEARREIRASVVMAILVHRVARAAVRLGVSEPAAAELWVSYNGHGYNFGYPGDLLPDPEGGEPTFILRRPYDFVGSEPGTTPDAPGVGEPFPMVRTVERIPFDNIEAVRRERVDPTIHDGIYAALVDLMALAKGAGLAYGREAMSY